MAVVTPNSFKNYFKTIWHVIYIFLPYTTKLDKNYNYNYGMKILNYIKWILLCWILMVIGCQDIIEFDLEKIERNRIIVQGKMVITDVTRVDVQIRRLFDFTASGASGIVADKVVLYDDKGRQKMLNRTFRSNFTISIQPDDHSFPVSTDRQYYIEALLNDGRVFISDWVSPIEAPSLDKIFYEIEKRDFNDNLNLYVSTKLWKEKPPKNSYINWHLVTTYRFSEYKYANHDFDYCYATGGTRYYEPHFIDPSTLEDGQLNNLLIYDSRIDYRFAEGIMFSVFQESVTKEVYDFYKNTNIINNKNGNMYDPPPGILPSNIRNKIDENEISYGIFYATKPSVKRVYISPDEAGNPNRRCATIQASSLPECSSCIRLENSTREKPDFWPE